MKILIAFNFAVGFLLATSFIVSEKTEFATLAGIVLLPCFFVLALVNFILIFKNWKKEELRAFIPFGTYSTAFALFVLVSTLGTDLILKGTPSRPDSFFTQQTRTDLKAIADKLIAERRDKNFAPEVYADLKKHSLKTIFVDTNQEVVVFGIYHSRRWDEYIYSKNGSTNLLDVNTGYGPPIERSLGENWYFRSW